MALRCVPILSGRLPGARGALAAGGPGCPIVLRILQIGLGPLGRRIAADLVARGLGDLAGAVDSAPELAGRSLKRLVPGSRCPSKVLGGLDQFDRWRDVDAAVVATSSGLEQCAPTFLALLERGLAVVSTCEELVWPWQSQPSAARALDEAAKRRGGRLLGTGVNPGFVMDALPLFASGVCRRVEHVRVERFQDASDRRVPFQRKIGVGLSAEEFMAAVKARELRHVGLFESLHFLAHHLGLAVDHWDEEIGMIAAAKPLASALGRIQRGRAAGVEQLARGYAGEQCLIELHFRAAIGLADPRDRIAIEGEPAIDLCIAGGIHGDVATAAIVLNAIGPLRAAAPGLHSMASIAVPACAPAVRSRGAVRSARRAVTGP
jgi:4-hydroxy-tetrahydrodipicolinate reductase